MLDLGITGNSTGGSRFPPIKTSTTGAAVGGVGVGGAGSARDIVSRGNGKNSPTAAAIAERRSQSRGEGEGDREGDTLGIAGVASAGGDAGGVFAGKSSSNMRSEAGAGAGGILARRAAAAALTRGGVQAVGSAAATLLSQLQPVSLTAHMHTQQQQQQQQRAVVGQPAGVGSSGQVGHFDDDNDEDDDGAAAAAQQQQQQYAAGGIVFDSGAFSPQALAEAQAQARRQAAGVTAAAGAAGAGAVAVAVTAASDRKPKGMQRAKQWTAEVENCFRYQLAGWRDEFEYRSAYAEAPPVWDAAVGTGEPSLVRCLQNKTAGHFMYFRNRRECEDKHLPKVKLYTY